MIARKVAIITGSGRGMGAAIARKLANDGYNISVFSPSGAAELLGKALGGIGLTGSVTDVNDLQKLVDLTLKKYES